MIIIDDMQISIFAPCGECMHYGIAGKCKAFPDGIPDVILNGENNHSAPYDGDNGIQFQLKKN